jgi:hypothetical protein
MNGVNSILESFLPITLAATIEQASLQRRVDTKYLTDDVTVTNLLSELADSFRVLEIEGRRIFRYRSEYLDSPGRDAYRAHLQGRRRRYKCRVRNYVDSGECHVEVKLKGSRGETVKYRAPYGDDQSVGDCADFLAACVDDAYGLPVDHRLLPVLEVEYRRITLVSLTSPERVTLDNGLSFLDLTTQRGRALSDTHWIVETKSPRGQGYTDGRLRAAQVHPVNVSKYVLGVALTDPGIRVNEYAALIRSLDVGALVGGRSRHLEAA